MIPWGERTKARLVLWFLHFVHPSFLVRALFAAGFLDLWDSELALLTIKTAEELKRREDERQAITKRTSS